MTGGGVARCDRGLAGASPATVEPELITATNDRVDANRTSLGEAVRFVDTHSYEIDGGTIAAWRAVGMTDGSRRPSWDGTRDA